MSADSLPITAERFARALADLSLSSLYLKVAELENSIVHLQKSNAELEEYVRREQDRECYEALVENREVIRRMEERIELVKKEVVEVRGLPFKPKGEDERRSGGAAPVDGGVNGAVNGEDPQVDGGGGAAAAAAAAAAQNGTRGSNSSAEGAQNEDTVAAAEQEEEGVFL